MYSVTKVVTPVKLDKKTFSLVYPYTKICFSPTEMRELDMPLSATILSSSSVSQVYQLRKITTQEEENGARN